MKINKKFLVRAVAKEAGFTQAEAEKVMKEFIRQLNRALLRGEKIEIRGWGTWSVGRLDGRKNWKNPKTGEIQDLPPLKTIRFKPIKALKELLSGRTKGSS